MKRVTIRNNFHNTEARIMVPEILTTTEEAVEWMERESEEEYRRFGRYGLKRKKLLEMRRKLCGIKECRCGLYSPEEIEE